jgi:hypothetical protein
MSQENVVIARRGYEHFIRTQDVLDEVFRPDYVLDMSRFRGWPERHTYRLHSRDRADAQRRRP